MKKSCARWILPIAIILSVCTGCASQSKKTGTMAEPPPASGETGAESKSAAGALTPEEEALFDDDMDGWEIQGDQENALVADPLEPYNRAMFHFNDKLYVWVLRPLSLGYRKVTPQLFRTGISNFFTNLTTPIRFANCLLQGKGKAATAELSKFIFNSTYGVLGFGDLFKDYPEMYPDAEDFGQTLGAYGIGDGFFIVWPVLGASTLRDTVGLAGDYALNPVSYVENTQFRVAITSVDMVNRLSFRIEDIDAAKEAAFDPYEAHRNFYIQLRQSKIGK
jgi:phospholipid-binding lipoprotein MlaA